MIQWLQITSGRGPAECCWVVAQLIQTILREAKENSIAAHVLEAIPGEQPRTLRSALIVLEGERALDFSSQFTGTVQWIGTSPFRPRHKRHNWYAGVESITFPEHPVWSEQDIKIETMRSSGPGGQHVNKTETAVRAVHVPTGLSAIAREERSQYLNRKLALARLSQLIKGVSRKDYEQAQKERWNAHNSLERGNPVRVFEGPEFTSRPTNPVS